MDTSWKEDIEKELKRHGETWDDVVAHTLSDEDFNKKFDHGYGGVEGSPFTLWTKNRVYFPACYDGAEWVASVQRNPILMTAQKWVASVQTNEVTSHIGGG